ncbi:hypothetical protein [Microbacterium candidum]|uniref:Uncharacterized protein n=1 Tax=Microbacterium candidum TaxID=3041922 RepID=A0ABT7N2Z5_9MICO|nr:hypothetical protein [Microbacterium sp. ASV49]MDL9981078.1 hypothetical protein [Microbacterium sp. ASV49]
MRRAAGVLVIAGVLMLAGCGANGNPGPVTVPSERPAVTSIDDAVNAIGCTAEGTGSPLGGWVSPAARAAVDSRSCLPVGSTKPIFLYEYDNSAGAADALAQGELGDTNDLTFTQAGPVVLVTTNADSTAIVRARLP